MKNFIKKSLQIFVGLAILLLFLYNIGFLEIWNTLKTMNLWWLIPVLIIPFPVQLLSSLNYKILLKSIDKNVSIKHLFKSMTLSFSIGKVLPSRVGEFSIILFLNKKGVYYGEGLSISLLDKIITFSLFAVLALVGIFIFLNIKLFLLTLGFCIFVFLASLFFILYQGSRNFIKKYILRSYSEYFTGFYKTINLILKKKKRYILLNFVNTILKWLISFFAIWFVFKSFGVTFPIYYIYFVSAIVQILSLIPITLSGLGIREVSGAYLYSSLVNIDASITTSVMLINTAKLYLIAFIFYLMNLDLLKKK